MNEQQIMVSVCCLAYNHAKFIGKCLDGFVKQKTNFKFEVLIHDDASTDGTQDIIREYEKKYPDIIKPIYQTENQYSKGIKISRTYQYPRAKGKYIALCEGDDYWFDENKLQLQYEALERNKNAVFCAHKVELINESGVSLHKYYPRTDLDKYNISPVEMMDYMVEFDSYPFQTSSYFVRKEVVIDMINSNPEFMSIAPTGDVVLMLYSIIKGNFLYINRPMSCYRENSLGSWNNKQSNELRIINMKISIDSLLSYDIYTKKKFHVQIEKIIKQYEYKCFLFEKKYNIIVQKEFRELLKKEPIKVRLYCYLSASVPFVIKLLGK